MGSIHHAKNAQIFSNNKKEKDKDIDEDTNDVGKCLVVTSIQCRRK